MLDRSPEQIARTDCINRWPTRHATPQTLFQHCADSFVRVSIPPRFAAVPSARHAKSACGPRMRKMPRHHSGFHRLSLMLAHLYTGLELRELGGHVPKGVTAHGSPIGPLQFDWLEAALGRQVPRFLSSLGCGGLSVRHPGVGFCFTFVIPSAAIYAARLGSR